MSNEVDSGITSIEALFRFPYSDLNQDPSTNEVLRDYLDTNPPCILGAVEGDFTGTLVMVSLRERDIERGHGSCVEDLLSVATLYLVHAAGEGAPERIMAAPDGAPDDGMILSFTASTVEWRRSLKQMGWYA